MSGSTEFRSLTLDGLFYEKAGQLTVCQEGQDVDVLAELSAFLGRTVRLALHFQPPQPVDESRWGMGCCHWQSAGTCPAGHHEASGKMLVLSLTGVVLNDPWRVGDHTLPLTELPGHDVRLFVVSDFDPTSLSAVTPEGLEKLTQEIGNMRQFLGGLLDRVRG